MRRYSARLEQLMGQFMLDPKDGLVEAARCPRCRRQVGGIYEVNGRRWLFAMGGEAETLIHYVVEDPDWWANMPDDYHEPTEGVPGKLRPVRSRNEYSGSIAPVWPAGNGAHTLVAVCKKCRRTVSVTIENDGQLSTGTRRTR